MSKMISVASGFQYSVNIGYDLNNDDKLKNFIPTKSALMLLKDILSSTALDATERARVLVSICWSISCVSIMPVSAYEILISNALCKASVALSVFLSARYTLDRLL